MKPAERNDAHAWVHHTPRKVNLIQIPGGLGELISAVQRTLIAPELQDV